MRTKKVWKVFIASPSDLAAERQIFREQIANLNEELENSDHSLKAIGWEDTLSGVGRLQHLINRGIDECDVFVLAMYKRWGQSSPDCAYRSYTEEEYNRALQRHTSTGSPAIYIFFKHVDPDCVGAEDSQMQQVLDFRSELEASKRVHYRVFETEESFAVELRRHIREFLRKHASEMEGHVHKSAAEIELEKHRHDLETRHLRAETNKARLEAWFTACKILATAVLTIVVVRVMMNYAPSQNVDVRTSGQGTSAAGFVPYRPNSPTDIQY